MGGAEGVGCHLQCGRLGECAHVGAPLDRIVRALGTRHLGLGVCHFGLGLDEFLWVGPGADGCILGLSGGNGGLGSPDVCFVAARLEHGEVRSGGVDCGLRHCNLFGTRAVDHLLMQSRGLFDQCLGLRHRDHLVITAQARQQLPSLHGVALLDKELVHNARRRHTQRGVADGHEHPFGMDFAVEPGRGGCGCRPCARVAARLRGKRTYGGPGRNPRQVRVDQPPGDTNQCHQQRQAHDPSHR